MPSKSAEALEFPALVELLKRYLVSPLGEWQHAEFAAAPFRPTRESAEAVLAETAEAMDWLRTAENNQSRGGLRPPRFHGLRDMRAAAGRLRAEGSVLEPEQILGLAELLDRAEQLRVQLGAQSMQFPKLSAYAERFADFSILLREISGKIRPDGELEDHASPTLSRLRRQIDQHRQSVQKSLDKFVREQYQEGVLQDDYSTIRNGRLVVPVKAGWKWRVEGVIHSASGTGQTVFIEPLETIVLNNRLVRLLEDEQREVHRILREMTARLRVEAGAVQQAIQTLAELEWLFAKANFGREFRCAIPTFSPPRGEDGPERLRLDWARHPLLEDVLRKGGRKIIPLSVKLEGTGRVLVVSGPNAGGKTIVLKTVGLLTLMAQATLPVPAEEAEFPWFGRVLADIGDSQSITESLSTFSAHIEKLKTMMAEADARSLVLLDELGAATDPQEGGALAIAVVEHFLQRGAFHIASTHLPALKIYAVNAEGVQNAAVGFDAEGLSPTFRLLVGVPGQSAGLAMAQRFGMPPEVIERARRAMASQEGDAAAFLNELHRRVEEYEQAQKNLRQAEHELHERERALGREWEKREKAKLNELERRVTALIEQFASEAKQTLGQIGETGGSRRALQNAQQRVSKTQREMRERFESTAQEALGRQPEKKPPPAAGPLAVGAQVQLATLGATGQVLRALSGDNYEVQVGRLKMRVSRNDITQILPAAGAGAGAVRLPARVTLQTAPREASSLSEINVIGKRREEAEEAVDKFLDEAVLAEVNRIRVIHGHGMNVLRTALWQMFANHIHVGRYYQAEQHEGGAGATIVEVKESG
jgi:DNA mismatch repair protein MutS2